MANTLKKVKENSPAPATAAPASAPGNDGVVLEFMRRMEAATDIQLRPVFPEEMQDPDSAKVLKTAFFLGARLAVAEMGAMSIKPVIEAAQRLAGQLISERKQAANITIPG
jgi:hypothetical protein